MLLATLLLLTTGNLETCGDYMKAGETVRSHWLDGMEDGYAAGQFLYYRLLVLHEAAGDNSETVARIVASIIKDGYVSPPPEKMGEWVERFCSLDKRGKLKLYLLYPTIVHKLRGGSGEEFMRDVKVLMDMEYGEKDYD